MCPSLSQIKTSRSNYSAKISAIEVICSLNCILAYIMLSVQSYMSNLAVDLHMTEKFPILHLQHNLSELIQSVNKYHKVVYTYAEQQKVIRLLH